jgi:putative endonuclease
MVLVRFIVAAFSRLLRRNSNSADAGADERHELGRKGEELAVKFLRGKRYKILYRNFRAPKGGEVDIVCRDKATNTLVFVEVKTRSSIKFGTPAEAVNAGKQHLISRGALAWLRLLDNPDVNFRFDIVEVLVEDGRPACNLIRDAFQLPEPYIY